MLEVLHFFKNLLQPDSFKLFLSWNFSFFGGEGETINMGLSFYAKNLGVSDSSSKLLRIIISTIRSCKLKEKLGKRKKNITPPPPMGPPSTFLLL